MQLTEHRDEGHLFVRAAGASSVQVIDRVFHRSFILAPTRVVEDFPATRVAELNAASVSSVLELDPAVVLLGTGSRAVFLSQAVLAEFLRRGVGVEVMDNAAAARTFNVLVGEGRNAVAVFLLADANDDGGEAADKNS